MARHGDDHEQGHRDRINHVGVGAEGAIVEERGPGHKRAADADPHKLAQDQRIEAVARVTPRRAEHTQDADAAQRQRE